LIAAALGLGAGACAPFRRGEPTAAVERLEHPALDRLRAGEFTPEIFESLFPPWDHLLMSARVLARRRGLFGKTYLDVSLIAEPSRRVRLAGRKPGDGTLLFDLVADGAVMSVYAPPSQTLYQGPIASRGSPFGAVYGVEPWDLPSIVLVARRLAESAFTAVARERTTALVVESPRGRADGLVEVEIDTATGLPVRAVWRREVLRWEAAYEGWSLVPNAQNPDQRHLLPLRAGVRVWRTSRPSRSLWSWFDPLRWWPGWADRPWVRIDLMARPDETRLYRIDPTLRPDVFALVVPAQTRQATLDELGEALRAP